MQVLSPLIGLLSLLVAAVCMVGLAKPSLIRMRKRRHAAAALGLAIVVLGFAIDLDPPPENQGPIGPGLLGLWLGCVGTAWGLLILLRRVRVAKALPDAAVLVEGEDQAKPPFPKEGPRDLLTEGKSKATAIIAEAKRKADKSKAAKNSRAELDRQAVAVEAERRPHLRQAASPDIVRSGALAAWDGRSRTNHDYHSGDDDGEYGKILRRGTDGRPLVFEYANRDGEVSDRMLFDWVEYPRHIQGVCQSAHAVRAFRKDRVTGWQAGTDQMLRAPKGKSRQ